MQGGTLFQSLTGSLPAPDNVEGSICVAMEVILLNAPRNLLDLNKLPKLPFNKHRSNKTLLSRRRKHA